MVDYRRFDHIDVDSDEEETKQSSTVQIPTLSSGSGTSPGLSPSPPQQPVSKMTKKGKENRFRFEYVGNLIYEWDQSLEEVRIDLSLYLSPASFF